MVCPDCDGRGDVLDAPADVLAGRTYWDVCPTCLGAKEVPDESEPTSGEALEG